MDQVDGGPGTVVLADSVDGAGIVETAQIIGQRLGREHRFGVLDPVETPTCVELGVGPDHPFREVVGLDQEEPVIGVCGEVFVHDLEHGAGGNDVQGHQLQDAIWMVLGQPV